ncbi:MAG TPA: creatininase family protein [Alphaproteobacteria bacterium]
MTARYWKDLTTEDFAVLDPARQVAILPVAAVEQHGPHLPLGTDAAINTGIVARAVALMPMDTPVLVLPLIQVGLSPEHRDFPGTLTLSPETLLRLVIEIAESVARAGLRKIILFNSHGGQPAVLDLAAQQLRTANAMMAVVAHSWRMMRPAEFFPPAEREAGIHAGANETSLLLHLHPGLVRRDRIADHPSAARGLERDHPELAGGGRFKFAWQTQDLNPSGAVGDARLGTAEAGRALVEQAAHALVALASDLSRLPLDVLTSRP